MIDSLTIASTSSFGDTPELLNELSQFNFLFGSNGTGKTTISRVMADEAMFPKCKVVWKGGTKLLSMVYNRDFVEKNFNQSVELKGVFTLGEKQVDTLNKITVARGELDSLTKKIESLTLTLQGDNGAGGKKGELSALETGLRDKCWAQKQKHDPKLQGAFEGYRNNAEKFKSKIVQERAANKATLLTLEELENKAGSVFGTTPVNESLIVSIDAAKTLAHESNPILKKRVIGKDDVDIAAMIKRLGCSDWVKTGRSFYEVNEGVCPFCQQHTTETLTRSLDSYFDEAFVTDSKAIEDLATNYVTDSERLQRQIAAIIAAPSRFLDVDALKVEKQLVDSKLTINTQIIAGKKKEPSQVVELESLSNVLESVKAIIDSGNAKSAEHNRMVVNLAQERNTLTAQVWRFVLEELKLDLAAYDAAHDGLKKAADSLITKIAETEVEKANKEKDIRELEKQTTSIQPAIDGINALLSSFGFKSFVLAKAPSGSSYKLVRSDGSDAKMTLSEGEKTFVTFLYFYYLLKGSDSDNGTTTNRIVVFDDPVSSLDSDILFIVGSLIKGLFDEVRKGVGPVKQIFVLTHNVYFHKEVTFSTKRRDEAMAEETFWVVRKSNLLSRVERHKSNPIKTSYELLWAEVRRSDRSNLTIQNTLRRIVENYFKILGGVDPDDICGWFDGGDKLVCRSLFSWVNDGSHFAHDDLYISIDNSSVDTYLRVFRAIFEKLGHLAHYKMMMGDAFVENAVAVTTAPATPISSMS